MPVGTSPYVSKGQLIALTHSLLILLRKVPEGHVVQLTAVPTQVAQLLLHKRQIFPVSAKLAFGQLARQELLVAKYLLVEIF